MSNGFNRYPDNIPPSNLAPVGNTPVLPRVLFIDTQERERVKGLDLPMGQNNMTVWIEAVTGLPPEQITTVNVADGETLPGHHGFDGIIGGGSGHSVNEDLPWMRATGDYLKTAVDLGVSVLGFCFTHQLLAKTLDGIVEGNEDKRFGVKTVMKTLEGTSHAILPAGGEFELFTSHRDVVVKRPQPSDLRVTELARGNTVLQNGASVVDPNEVLSYTDPVTGHLRAITTQSHPELNFDIIKALSGEGDNSFTKGLELSATDRIAVLAAAHEARDKAIENGRVLVRAWLDTIMVHAREEDLPT